MILAPQISSKIHSIQKKLGKRKSENYPSFRVKAFLTSNISIFLAASTLFIFLASIRQVNKHEGKEN